MQKHQPNIVWTHAQALNSLTIKQEHAQQFVRLIIFLWMSTPVLKYVYSSALILIMLKIQQKSV